MRLLAFRNRALKVAAAAMSVFALTAPASAFSVSELSPAASARQPTVALYQHGVDQPKLEQVWCRWGCGGWGWGGPALVGGLAAGALIGGALAAPYYGGPGPYGGPYYAAAPYPGCWRSVWTYYGWRRVWAC